MTDFFVPNYEDNNNETGYLGNKQPFSFGITFDKVIGYDDCYPMILENKEKYAEYIRFKIGYINLKYPIDYKTINGGMIYFQFTLISRDFMQRKIKYKPI